jgi:hypothetical protein
VVTATLDTVGSPARSTWLRLLAVSPLLPVVAASFWSAAGWGLGADPFWKPAQPPLNVAEAAATGDLGEIVRLITLEQQNPNAEWPLRAGLDVGPATMTPMQAAIAARQNDAVAVLLRHGGIAPVLDGRSGRNDKAAP